MRKLAPFLSLFLLVFIAPPGAAQSSLTVEQAVVTITNSATDHLGQFTFSGPGLVTLTGGLREGNHNPRCSPCVGGENIQFHSFFAGSSIRQGDLVTGTQTRTVFYSGYVEFLGPMVTLPVRYSRVPRKITVPLILRGNLEVHSTNPFSNPNLLFQIPINLEGYATLTIQTIYVDWTGRPVYKIVGLTYRFSPPQKTIDN